MKNAVAIDLGSANTVIYQVGGGVVLSEPSVVAFDVGSKKKVKAVGKEAKNIIGKTADGTEIVFPVVEGQIVDEKAAGAMVENFLNKISTNKFGLRPQVLLSIPCGLDNAEIKQYERAFNSAGVYGIDFVESPILSALGSDAPITTSTPCFIIDIGGGSTNIAAVSLDGVIAGVNIGIGGNSIDATIIKCVEREYGLKIGSLTAEKLKISIGSLYENEVNYAQINGRDIAGGKPRSVTVPSGKIYSPIKHVLDKIFEVADMVMSKLPAEVSAEIRSNGVYLAGGTAKIPGVAEYFSRTMAIRANLAEYPDLANAIGGSKVAANHSLLKKVRIHA
ncbi:MAG: rod shape-determining protein [Clostridia bacterium]|nr:rod shape-determining protein [Clostridia bacterium]MBR1676677.1 rod shape-determining protein [Clostridia bacterium]